MCSKSQEKNLPGLQTDCFLDGPESLKVLQRILYMQILLSLREHHHSVQISSAFTPTVRFFLGLERFTHTPLRNLVRELHSLPCFSQKWVLLHARSQAALLLPVLIPPKIMSLVAQWLHNVPINCCRKSIRCGAVLTCFPSLFACLSKRVVLHLDHHLHWDLTFTCRQHCPKNAFCVFWGLWFRSSLADVLTPSLRLLILHAIQAELTKCYIFMDLSDRF